MFTMHRRHLDAAKTGPTPGQSVSLGVLMVRYLMSPLDTEREYESDRRANCAVASQQE